MSLSNNDIYSKQQQLQLQLKNRLFDISKRNRLLYYKPNTRLINLTQLSALSVNIDNDTVLYWSNTIAEKVSKGKDIVISDFVDIQEHPYFTDIFNKIRLASNKNIHEYGFSSLRLVISFLHWYHPTENPDEKIVSPLVLLPVSLVKKKGLKEQYVLEIQDTEAEVNPIVVYLFKKLFNLSLPEKIKLEEASLLDFYQTIFQQIQSAKTNVSIHLNSIPDFQQLKKDALALLSKLKQKKVNTLEKPDNIFENFNEHVAKHPLLDCILYQRNPEKTIISQHLLYASRQSKNRQWQMDISTLVLGNFNYKKMSLVSDYNEIIDNEKHNDVFDLLFNDIPKKLVNQEDTAVSFQELYNVVVSDPTQNKAIYNARQNTSYIIQGPPGTGKSQTITNLIADFIANGKKVLFVCEKRAAIDVVFYRLKQEKLDELCCLIHDSQADKKTFIQNLKTNYETSLKNNANIDDIKKQREDIIQYIQQELKIIAHFTKLMQVEIESAHLKSIDIYNKLIELDEFSKELQHVTLDDVVGYKEWTKFGETIEQLFDKLKTHSNKNYFAEHPISQLNDLMIETAPTPNDLKSKLSEITALTDEITEYLDLTDFDEHYKENVYDLKQLLQNIDELKLFIDAKQLDLLNEKSASFNTFLQQRNELIELDKDIEQLQQKNKNWKQKFSATDTENALQIALNLENAFFRIFYSSYRKMRSSIKTAYDFSQHQIKPAYSQILQQLKQEYDTIDTQSQKITTAEKQYKLGNLEEAYLKIQDCRQQLHPEIKELVEADSNEYKVQELFIIKSKFDRLIKLVLQVLDSRNTNHFATIEQSAESILPVIDEFNIYLPYLTALVNASPRLRQLLKTQHYSPKQIQTILAQKSMSDFYVLHKEIQKIEGVVLEYHLERIQKLYQQYLKINSTYIRAKQREKFMQLVFASEISTAGKSEAEKEEKRLLQEGRKMLENEFGKTMRYKSIRELATAESGKFIRELKPVWLMSPLSVSDTLPLDEQYFDVVIFDEASQITLEEGIPPIFRASQAIIVGDEMQMPPSNFFGSTNNDIDDIWLEDETNALEMDADSLLNQAARKLPSVLLGWHYRSRHESLISFSNAAFYDNKLLTIPDKIDAHQTLNEIIVSELNEVSNNVQYLFDRSISYHYLKNGIYESRTNEKEANYIAELLYQFYINQQKESIGIVAFSIEQQTEIEDAIDKKARDDKAFDKWLEDEYKRIEDNQFIGLFIKNLENVQGDERDIIIISTCYGYDKQQKMLMNFGPINRKGGEKRLNVIFSRAKKHVCVVSSIKHTDIKNVHNEGANFFKKYLQYAELISSGNLVNAQSILSSLTLQQTQQTTSVNHLQEQICNELHQLGYYTKRNIGQSHFKCQIGIKNQETDKGYSLGIILDDDAHYSNPDILEQYLLKPNILKNFGWNILQVYTKDWLENKAKVMQLILHKLEGKAGKNNDAEIKEINTDDLLNQRIVLAENKQKNLEENFNIAINPNTVRLLLDDNKFWQITQNKNSLVIEYGKINTNGQKIIKPYETDADATKEMKRLIEQKKKKGYR